MSIESPAKVLTTTTMVTTPFTLDFFLMNGFPVETARKFIETIYKIGDKVLRNGFEWTISEIIPHRDHHIVASITLSHNGNEVQVGHYDLCLHEFLH